MALVSEGGRLLVRSWVALALWFVGCGARTEPYVKHCQTDAECGDGLICNGIERCVDRLCIAGTALECDDFDPCTRDECVESGRATEPGCRNERDAPDLDRDGFEVSEIEPRMCSRDCDDTDPLVNPLATEVCNGRDDDCDEAIDEGAWYAADPVNVNVTGDPAPDSAGSLAWNAASGTWGSTFGRYVDGSADVFFQELEPDGTPLGEPALLSPWPGDAYGAALSGDSEHHAAAWEDRRDGNFEIYFNRLTADGQKLAPDLRLTNTPGSSVYPTIAWTGREYAIAWQESSDDALAEHRFHVALSFVSADGFEIGDEITVTRGPSTSEGPSIAVGRDHVGLAFVDARVSTLQIYFAATDFYGQVVGPEVRVSATGGEAVAPAIAALGDRFVVVWQERDGEANSSVYAAAIDVGDELVVSEPVAVAAGASWARDPSALSAGDRVYLGYSDDRSGDLALYVGQFDPDLRRMAEDVQLTPGEAPAVGGRLALGDGSVGVLFDDQRAGNWEAFFARLVCVQ